jgi:hypothetical protein
MLPLKAKPLITPIMAGAPSYAEDSPQMPTSGQQNNPPQPARMSAVLPASAPLPLINPPRLENAMAQPAISADGMGSTGEPLAKLPTLRPMVQLSTDPLEQIEAHKQNQLQRIQWQQSHPWGTAENHPGTLGKIAHVLSVVGNMAGDIAGPAQMEMINGTQLNRASRERSLENGIAGIEQQRGMNAERQATTQESLARLPLIGAQTREAVANADARENPQPAPKEEHWNVSPEYTGPNGEPVEVEQNSGQTRLAQGANGFKRVGKPGEDKEETPEQQAFHGYIAQGMTPAQAYTKLHQKELSGEPGTWQLAEDASGKPVLYNTKTAQTRDADGMQRPGTHAKAAQADEGEQQAINYAEDYLKRAVFTGSGDEALQEKFFELAKPKTGFRMTQPQMDMLQHSRDWMSGMMAHVRHATQGTWFSPQQRDQILQTMRQLSEARHGGNGNKGAASQTPSGATMKVPGSDGKMHWSDGKQDLGVAE